jgi:hypothetical protein
MTVYEPRDRNKFLKGVGSADDPVALDWMDSAPRELEHIEHQGAAGDARRRLPRYYAAVHQKLYGIVEVFSRSKMDAQKKRWPYYAQVRPKLIIRDMDRAPSIDALNVSGGRDFRKTVKRMD